MQSNKKKIYIYIYIHEANYISFEDKRGLSYFYFKFSFVVFFIVQHKNKVLIS